MFKKQEMKRAVEKMEVDNGNPEKTGFIIRGSRHINANFYHNGKFILKVVIPGGRGDLPIGTQENIRRQLNLNREEFIDFGECPMRLEGFVEAQKEAGAIES